MAKLKVVSDVAHPVKQNKAPVKLFVGTPSHDQKVNIGYLNTVLGLNGLLPFVETSVFCLGGNSIITDCRNRIFSVFLESGCDYLLFLDSDVAINTKDVLAMIEAKKDIIAIPIMRKNPTGPTANVGNAIGTPVNGIIEVDGIATATMMISRDAALKFIANNVKTYSDQPEHTVNNTSLKGSVIYDVFKVFAENGKYWCEDYYFCKQARDIGLKVYALLNSASDHFGTIPYSYRGN